MVKKIVVNRQFVFVWLLVLSVSGVFCGCEKNSGTVTVGGDIPKIEQFEKYARTGSVIAGLVLGATERETVSAAFDWVIARVENAEAGGVRAVVKDALEQAKRGWTVSGKQYKLQEKHAAIVMGVVEIADAYFAKVEFKLEDLITLLKAGKSGLGSTRGGVLDGPKNTSW